MIAEILVLAALPLLLIAAALWDVASFTIPNTIAEKRLFWLAASRSMALTAGMS